MIVTVVTSWFAGTIAGRRRRACQEREKKGAVESSVEQLVELAVAKEIARGTTTKRKREKRKRNPYPQLYQLVRQSITTASCHTCPFIPLAATNIIMAQC